MVGDLMSASLITISRVTNALGRKKREVHHSF